MSAVSEIMSDGIVTADGDAGLSALDIAVSWQEPGPAQSLSLKKAGRQAS